MLRDRIQAYKSKVVFVRKGVISCEFHLALSFTRILCSDQV